MDLVEDFKNMLSQIAGKHTHLMPPATHISGILARYDRLKKFNDELREKAQEKMAEILNPLPTAEEKNNSKEKLQKAFKTCSDDFYQLHFKQ